MGTPAQLQVPPPGQRSPGRERQRRDAANLKWARDPERLLTGERSESSYVEEASHWVDMYRELRQFNLALITAVSRRLTQKGQQGDGAEGPDLALIQAHLERIEYRLRQWERMRAALAIAVPTDGGQATRGGRRRPSR